MALSQNKMKILNVMWEIERPLRSREIAEKVDLSVPSSTMHLLQLRKSGYVFSPQKSLYAITSQGKEAICLPKIDKNKAWKILNSVSPEKAFYFYTSINQYLGLSVNNLIDFYRKIPTIDPNAIEFHMSRGDFEFWFHNLGDTELAKRMNVLNRVTLSKEELREQVYLTVKTRCEELLSISEKR